MEIRRESYGSPAAETLSAALEDELLCRYGGVPGWGGEPPEEAFDPPEGVFLVGWIDGEPVACGGIARYDDATAEIRRMYVVPAKRGRGLSRRVLTALEDEARRLGYSFVRLETGYLQTEALRLYVSTGFGPIPPYGPYVGDERSVCFEKRLD